MMLNKQCISKYQTGVLCFQEQQYKESAAYFTIAAKDGMAVAMYMLANQYLHGWGLTKDNYKALSWHEKALTCPEQLIKGKILAEAYFYAARACDYINFDHMHNDLSIDQNLYEKAFKYYHKAYKNGNYKACMHLGIAYDLGQGIAQNNEQAIFYFKQATKDAETKPQAFNTLGILYANNGFNKKSQKFLEKAKQAGYKTTISSMFVNLHENDIYTNDQNFLNYQVIPDKLEEKFIYYTLLMQYYFLNKKSKYYNAQESIKIFDQLQNDLDKVVNIVYPNYIARYAFNAVIQEFQCQIWLIEKKYDQIISLSHQNLDYLEGSISFFTIYNYIALAHYRLGQYQEAEQYWFKLALNKYCIDNLQINFSLGNLYFQQGKLEKALGYYLKEYKHNKQDDALLNNIALVYYKQKDYLSAIRYTHRAIDANPSNAILYLHLCTIYIKITKTSNSLYYLQQAIEVLEKAHEVDKEVNDTEQEKALEQIYRSIYKQLQQAVALTNKNTESADIAPPTASTNTSSGVEHKAKKKFKLAKIRTPIERAIREISKKIWGPDHPGDRDRGVYKVYIPGKEDVKIFTYITRKVLKSLSDYPRVKEEFKRLLRLGMTVVSNAQGEAGFKRLHDGSWEFKIKGKEIGDHRLKGNMIEGTGYIEKLIVLNKHITKAH